MSIAKVINELQYVSFTIDEQMYGLDIQIVKEVNPNIAITKVPLSDNIFRGLVNIRGQIILVMNISIIFGYAPCPITSNSQLIILKTAHEIQQISNTVIPINNSLFGDKPISFIVDKIGDVITIQEDSIEPTPPHISELNARFIKGVTKVDKKLMIILNAETLLST